MALALRIISVVGAVFAAHGQDAAPEATPDPFDCQEGLANWERGWSSAKKEWCCANKGLGCDPFDCHAGLANWEAGWAEAKKQWCCANKALGCPKPPPPPPPPPPAEPVVEVRRMTAVPEATQTTSPAKQGKVELNDKFWFAAASASKSEAEEHLKAGADINAGNPKAKGNPALYSLACANPPGAVEMAQWLITNRADINYMDSRGRTPLFCAASTGNTKLAEVFSSAAEMDPRGGHHVTPLHRATYRGDVAMVETLLKMRSNPHTSMHGGATAFDAASESDNDLLKKAFGIGIETGRRLPSSTPVTPPGGDL